jgi:hypothetical protein
MFLGVSFALIYDVYSTVIIYADHLLIYSTGHWTIKKFTDIINFKLVSVNLSHFHSCLIFAVTPRGLPLCGVM